MKELHELSRKMQPIVYWNGNSGDGMELSNLSYIKRVCGLMPFCKVLSLQNAI